MELYLHSARWPKRAIMVQIISIRRCEEAKKKDAGKGDVSF